MGKWQEFHKNGQLWIDGQIAVVPEQPEIYDYRTNFHGYEGKPVCKVGIWTKYYDNGQIGWQIDYGDGTHESLKKRKRFPSYRKDGTIIEYL